MEFRLVENPAQYGNDDRSKDENDNSTDGIHSIDVVLVEPLDDVGHADLGPHADNHSLTHHQITQLHCASERDIDRGAPTAASRDGRDQGARA